MRTYTDVLKENHGYSVLFHAGVASCPHGFIRKMEVSSVHLLTYLEYEAATVCARALSVNKRIFIRYIHVNFSLRLTAIPSQTVRRAEEATVLWSTKGAKTT